jgi:hypothetical protein
VLGYQQQRKGRSDCKECGYRTQNCVRSHVLIAFLTFMHCHVPHHNQNRADEGSTLTDKHARLHSSLHTAIFKPACVYTRTAAAHSAGLRQRREQKTRESRDLSRGPSCFSLPFPPACTVHKTIFVRPKTHAITKEVAIHLALAVLKPSACGKEQTYT